MSYKQQRTIQQDVETGRVTLAGSDRGLTEYGSVLDHGAHADGIADDTLAFSSAAHAAPAQNNITGAEGENLPRAPMCSVRVPAGRYRLTQLVDTGYRDVTWVLDSAAVIDGTQYLNGSVHRPGQRHNRQGYGTADYATGYSIRVNGADLDAIAEVTGIQTPSELATYHDRDSVGLYVDNTSQPATYQTDTASFTATTVTVPALSHDTLLRYRRGMIIDTKHSSKWSGIVESWNADGSVITVTGWYQTGNTSPTTPTNDAGIVLNGFTKIWAFNGNVHLTAGGYAESATAMELGAINLRGDSSASLSTALNRVWGMDMPTLHSTYKSQAAYMARGQWIYGHVSWDTEVGFLYRGDGVILMAHDAAGAETFRFYTSAGGDNVFDGGTHGVSVKTELKPYNDGTVELGLANRRWSEVFVATGTVSTSDEREKQQIEAIPDAVLDAWASVEYCRYRFNDAVESKGDGARWHTGVVAQQVKAAFEAAGLDPFAWGVLCHDEWDGGDRYGIRYEEALVLEAALMRRRMDWLEAAA